MSFIIPTEPDNWQEFEIDLDQETVKFEIRWNETDSAWYMDVTGVTFTLDLNGIKIAGGSRLIEPYAVREIGDIMLFDLEGKGVDPDFDNFGTRYVLVYWELSDL